MTEQINHAEEAPDKVWTLHSIRFMAPIESEHPSLRGAIEHAAYQSDHVEASPDRIVCPDGRVIDGSELREMILEVDG